MRLPSSATSPVIRAWCAMILCALWLVIGARDAEALKLNAAIPPGYELDSYTLTPDGQTVVYSLLKQQEVYVVRLMAVPVGGGAATTLVDIPLTAMQRSIDTFEITPDGTGIVFLSDKDQSQFTVDLFRVPINGSSAPLKLNTAPAPADITDFRVSPNSARVVFEEVATNKIYSVATTGGTPVELGLGTGSFLPRYRIAPDSTRVVFAFDAGSGRQLSSIPIAGGATTPLTNQTNISLPGENGFLAENYAITPDGTTVLFFAGNSTELWKTPIDQMAPVKLAGPISSIYGADFRLTPDATTAVFTAGAGSNFRIYRVPLNGSTSEQPVSAAGKSVAASEYQMSPNGQTFVYRVFASGKFRLFSVGLAGGNDVELTPATLVGIGAYNGYQIDPAGQRVVYGAEQDATGVIELYSVPIGGGGAIKLNKSPMPATADVTLSSVRISPDGVTVAFVADEDTDGVNEIFSAGLTSGGPQKVHPNLTPGKGVAEPSFTPDSQIIIYLGDQETDGIAELFATADPAPGPTAHATTTPISGVTTTPTASATTAATPTPLATRTPVPEGPNHCDDCIDNDFDGLIDRADGDCPPLAAGAGAGLSGNAAKTAVKCEKALGKIGSGFALKRVKALGACLQKALACVQVGDAACLAKAGVACGKAEAARQAALAKLAAGVAKSCGDPPVAAGDLAAAAGLAFAAEAAGCADFDVPIPDAAGVATCLATRHACRAEALVGMQIPRARELLTLAGRNAAIEAPCLPAGGGDGNVTGVKAVLKCQKTVAKAGAAYASARLKAEQKCADGVFACVQLKSTVAACRTKADATCAKLDAKIAAAATKLHTAFTKGCGGTLALADVFGGNGLGFDLRAGECTALATPADSISALASCVTAQHACRVDQLLIGQSPRGSELGALAP